MMQAKRPGVCDPRISVPVIVLIYHSARTNKITIRLDEARSIDNDKKYAVDITKARDKLV
jgi:hypothetical protein